MSLLQQRRNPLQAQTAPRGTAAVVSARHKLLSRSQKTSIKRTQLLKATNSTTTWTGPVADAPHVPGLVRESCTGDWVLKSQPSTQRYEVSEHRPSLCM